MNLKQALSEKWYGQGFNATPLYLGSAACSCEYMKRTTGLTFRNFLMIFKGNYGDMHYYYPDLDEIGRILEKKIEQDKDYFIKIKKIYDGEISESNKCYKKIESLELAKLTDGEIIKALNDAAECVAVSVGTAHILEPFALTTDIKIKQELGNYVREQIELNQIFSLLMTPVQESFVNKYEQALQKIAKEKDLAKKGKLISDTIRNYFWIRNSYAGRYRLTKEEIVEEVNFIKGKKDCKIKNLVKQKAKIIKKLRLPEKLVRKIKATEFLTYLQDERKANILLAVDYMERIMEELSSRIGFDIKYLRFMMPEELSLEKIKTTEFQNKLIERSKGCVYLYDMNRSVIITGKEYEAFVKEFRKEKQSEVKEFTGMTASPGTAVGPVKICTNISSIHKVLPGDVLVASMTRPEYLPAMKKTVAIVTDEGGITCHAAIVSREIGIPCVIGTRIATKVLKDGDIVEVKANHGRVIIIKEQPIN